MKNLKTWWKRARYINDILIFAPLTILASSYFADKEPVVAIIFNCFTAIYILLLVHSVKFEAEMKGKWEEFCEVLEKCINKQVSK